MLHFRWKKQRAPPPRDPFPAHCIGFLEGFCSMKSCTRSFNKRREDFDSLDEFNDYLEQKEEIGKLSGALWRGALVGHGATHPRGS